MNKHFSGIIVNVLKTSCNPATDEYETSCNVDFVLIEPQRFKLFGIDHIITCVCLRNSDTWDDTLTLCLVEDYDGGRTDIVGINIPEEIVQSMFDMLREEEDKPNQGILKRHVLSEDYLFENCITSDEE